MSQVLMGFDGGRGLAASSEASGSARCGVTSHEGLSPHLNARVFT